MGHQAFLAVPNIVRASGPQWIECTASTDRRDWNVEVRRFFDHFISIAPAGKLPGRQHFDPLDIAALMPHVWMLDVVRGPETRFRYRLVGTREVESLQREVTGLWFDEVHPNFRTTPGVFDRLARMIEFGVTTYRRGPVILNHHQDHKIVENCMVPMARDGSTVDMIAACSILYGRAS